MYHGKFDAKAKGHGAPDQTLENILKERDAAIAKRSAAMSSHGNTGRRHAAPSEQPTRTPAAPQSRRPAKSVEAEAPAKLSRTAKPAKAEKPTKKRGPRLGGVIFYTLYFLCIFGFFVGVFGGLNWLNGWLKAYEAAQPTAVCQQVFNQLFANPDWAKLYRLAGIEDTEFEGVAEYVAFMEDKVAGQPLNYVQTSAGLSGDKKYIVRLGNEKLAAFTLTGGDEATENEIPDWRLGQIELYVTRNLSFRIRKLDEHTVYINGKPLDSSYTIQIASTRADEMLPAGIPSISTTLQRIEGLMCVPQIVVYDATGTQRVEVLYNPDTDTYEEQSASFVISDEERNVVFGALEAFSGFMINASGSTGAVNKYFDSNSSAYSSITAMGSELWMNSDRGHQFLNEEILGYTRHTDDLFSVRASLTMHVICKDNTEKDYNVVESMFFTRRNGTWVCTEMTNVDITEPIGQVRLTFHDGSNNVISSDFYQTTSAMLTTPTVEAPAGKIFSGWVRRDGATSKTWSLVFTPDEVGNVYLNGDVLSPMDLYPLFE